MRAKQTFSFSSLAHTLLVFLIVCCSTELGVSTLPFQQMIGSCRFFAVMAIALLAATFVPTASAQCPGTSDLAGNCPAFAVKAMGDVLSQTNSTMELLASPSGNVYAFIVTNDGNESVFNGTLRCAAGASAGGPFFNVSFDVSSATNASYNGLTALGEVRSRSEPLHFPSLRRVCTQHPKASDHLPF